MENTEYDVQSRWLDRDAHYARGCEITMLATEAMLEHLHKQDPKPTRITDYYFDNGDCSTMSIKLRRLEKENEHVGTLLLVRKWSMEPADGLYSKTTLVLTPQLFSSMQSGISDKRRLVKDRYRTRLGDIPAMVYIYQGRLYGLVTIAVKSLRGATRERLAEEASEPKVGPLRSNRMFRSLTYQECYNYAIYPGSDFVDGANLVGRRFHDLTERLEQLHYNTHLDPAAYGFRRD